MIQIEHINKMYASLRFYATSEDNVALELNDCFGTLDELVERACDILVKHNFYLAEICAADNDDEVCVRLTRS